MTSIISRFSIPLVFLVSIAFSPVNLSGQCLKGDCQDGKGTFQMGGGMKYVGDFVEGKPEGLGILFFDNGDRYVGEWQGGARQGRGKFHFASGSTYTGQFVANRMKGRGKMVFAQGDVYEGLFENNLPEGDGLFTFVNGAEYVGHFVKGKFNGYGVMQYEDRSVYDGHWKMGKWHGYGEYTDSQGNSWAGEWIDGVAQQEPSEDSSTEELTSRLDTNQAIQSYEDLKNTEEIVFGDGSIYRGEVKNGIPFGRGEVSYSSGNRYEGYWRDNAPHGEGTMYYTSGRVVTAVWNNGEPIRDLNSLQQLSLEKIIVPDVSEDVKIWALVVGASSYAHLPALKYADDDAYQFYAFLKSPEGGAIPDEQIRLVIDESATIPNILAQMQSLFYKADSNDVVLMFFSGHGLNGSFVPIDYNGHSELLKQEWLKEVFHQSDARHKVLIADACYSGSLAIEKTVHQEALRSFYEELESADPGIAFLLSSKDQEVSLEDRGLKQGVFSHFLIRGMKGEADTDDNGLVTITELYQFLYRAVSKYTGGTQTPILSGEFDGNMPLGMRRSFLDY